MDAQQYQAMVDEFNRVQAEQVERLRTLVYASHKAFGVSVGHKSYKTQGPISKADLSALILQACPPITSATRDESV